MLFDKINEEIRAWALAIKPDISQAALTEILNPLNQTEIKGPLDNARNRISLLFPEMPSRKSTMHKQQKRMKSAKVVAKNNNTFLSFANNEVLTALVLDIILEVPINEIQAMPYIKEFIKKGEVLRASLSLNSKE